MIAIDGQGLGHPEHRHHRARDHGGHGEGLEAVDDDVAPVDRPGFRADVFEGAIDVLDGVPAHLGHRLADVDAVDQPVDVVQVNRFGLRHCGIFRLAAVRDRRCRV
jgi:hypothetical protein